MKTTKMVSGILGVAFSLYILVTSFQAAMWNMLTMSGHFNGGAGIVIGVLLLAGSIIRLCTTGVKDDSGSIVTLVFFAVGAAIAFALSPIYSYMVPWALACLAMAIISVIAIILKNLGNRPSGKKPFDPNRFRGPQAMSM